MSAVRKRNEYVGLSEFDVLIEDTSIISTYFSISELPETMELIEHYEIDIRLHTHGTMILNNKVTTIGWMRLDHRLE